jgi:DNA repair exonuclease SbcCD nuclease subunit
MKALAFSDIHADWITEGQPRFEDIKKAMNCMVEDAIERKVDRVFFLGDLCDPDKNLSVVRCIELLGNSVADLAVHGIASHLIPGNHDVIEDGSGSTTLTPLKCLGYYNGMVRVHERPELVHGIGSRSGGDLIDIITLPFTPVSHDYSAEKFVRDTLQNYLHRDRRLLVLSHLVVDGIQPGEETTEMPRGRNIVLPHKLIAELYPDSVILQGHYHRRQKFENVNVVGSLVNLTFSEEAHHPGYLYLEI